MKIAIAIITKNRPEVVSMAIYQHLKFLPSNATLYVIDDNSDKETMVSMAPFATSGLIYCYSTVWMGVAGARNAALELTEDADVVFLMDDDLIPKKAGWIELYLDTFRRVPRQHLLKAAPQPWAGVKMRHRGMNICENTTGTLFCMTRKLINTMGGFDQSLGKYGYEDGDYYNRLARTDLAPYGPMCVPSTMEDYLHVCDLDGDFEADRGLKLTWKHKSVLHDTKDKLLEESKINIIEKYNHATTTFIPYISAASVPSGGGVRLPQDLPSLPTSGRLQ